MDPDPIFFSIKHLLYSKINHIERHMIGLMLIQLGSIRCKHIVRWQHLSQIKARLLWLVKNVFSTIKTQQATSGTCAATYKLMEPH